MRASTSHIVCSLFTAAELVLEKQWLEIRDIFFGHNCVKQDITRALELANACPHKEALWLTSVFAGKTASTKRESFVVFLGLGENDARGLCFAALLDDGAQKEKSFVLSRRSTELGYAFAQAKMADETSGEECFRFATIAASQRERDSFYRLGFCFEHGRGCVKNENKARENFRIAAVL
jgi:hypothetical protein